MNNALLGPKNSIKNVLTIWGGACFMQKCICPLLYQQVYGDADFISQYGIKQKVVILKKYIFDLIKCSIFFCKR